MTDNNHIINMIRALCTLHNFCIDQNDEWELDPADRQILNEWMDAAFEKMQNSEWSEEMRVHENLENLTEMQTRHAGELKCKLLVEFVNGDTPASVKKSFWWRM